MKRLMISGFAALALLIAAATMLRSHSLSTATATVTAAQERSPTDPNKLVVEDFEDMSLVFSAPPKR
jgi:ABC-type glycerol-3-phosphate transport system substrate-binding protein